MRPGVNVYGYVFAESGMGEVARLIVSALREGGVDHVVIPVTQTLSRQESGFRQEGDCEPQFDINIISVNADSMALFVDRFGYSALEGRYSICVWAWELEDLPRWMVRSSDLIDEVWGISTFTAQSIAKAICRPVLSFPLPIQVPVPPDRTRHGLQLPEGFLFLYCFDLDSVFARKNPLAVIQAFSLAFPEEGTAFLVLKTINGDRHPENVRAIREAIRGRRDISLIDKYLTMDDQRAMIASCDAYVSLHRSEGFGLTMAEAMALGTPVIATAYSGNMDFMTDLNSFLVPFGFTEVGPGSQPYPPDARWADPDVKVAAELMRRVIEDPGEARKRSARARRDVEEFHSQRIRAKFVVDRIARIRRELDLRKQGAKAGVREIPHDENSEALNARVENLQRHVDEKTLRTDDVPSSGDQSSLRPEEPIRGRAVVSFLRNLLARLHHVGGGAARSQGRPSPGGEPTPSLNREEVGYSQAASSISRPDQLVAAARIAEEVAGDCEQRFGEPAVDVARTLRLLAARLRGLAR